MLKPQNLPNHEPKGHNLQKLVETKKQQKGRFKTPLTYSNLHQIFDIVIRQTSPGDANDEELERLSTAHAEKLSQLQEDMRKAMEAQKALEVEKQKQGILFNVCYCKYYAQVCYVGVQQRAKMMMQEEDNQGSDDEDEQHHGSK